MHFEIEFIHPFEDGNSRIGRLWQSVILNKWNKIFDFLPIETLVYENQQEYYNAIALSGKNSDSTVFIEFMLNMILKTIINFENSDKLNKVKEEYLQNLSKTEKLILAQILTFLIDYDIITMENARQITNKNEANLRKYFRNFAKLNILISEGNNKGKKYRLNKEILK